MRAPRLGPGRLAALATGPRSRWAVIGAWVLLALVLAPLQPKLQDEAANENEAFVADSAESTRADDLLDEQFESASGVTAVVVFNRPGAALTEADNQAMDGALRSLCETRAIPDLKAVVTPYGVPCGELGDDSIAPESGPPRVSADGSTALATVSTRSEDTRVVVEDVAALRAALPGPDAGGLRTFVSGEAGSTADASEAFEGIDGTLLAITLVLLLAILLATYRSPVAALVPIVVVGVAYLVAAGVVYGLVKATGLQVTGQATAILIVLMFGAGTDYCLLLVSRYREESGDVRRAAERTGPAIVSAGATVVAAMLVLLVADFRATRSMGPVLAVGVAVTVLAGLTLLPALLTVLGGRVFRPAAGPPGGGIWARAARLVLARPGTVTAAALAVLALGALGNLEGRGTLALTESFRDPPESVRGAELIAGEFGAGRAAPLDLVVRTVGAPDVLGRLDGIEGVASITAASASRGGGYSLFNVELADDPYSEAAMETVPRVRAALDGAGGALVGGITATAYDSREAQRSDAALIVPLTLVLVFLIVVALVRALVAPLYLVATVVLSYAFALGASSLLFTHVLGQPDSDPGLPLFAFIFLVALGVDYNLFLVSRIREERLRTGATRPAVGEALTRTGGVITSAGLILAGTFAALIALPLEGLVQMGFTIALGLLVDTFLVRVFLVPGIAVLLGERNWMPRFCTSPNESP